MDSKVSQTNTLLTKVCSDNEWDLIKHHNMKKHLNQYGVHFNKNRTAILVQNFKKFIQSKENTFKMTIHYRQGLH